MTRFLDRHPLVRRIALASLVFYALHGAVLEERASGLYHEVAHWPATEALIQSSAVFWTHYSWIDKQNRYCPKLRYSYEVSGQKFEEYNQVFDLVCWPDAYDFVASHPQGTRVRIAYDPRNPAVSIVPDAIKDPGYPWGDIVFGIAFLALLFIDLLGSHNVERDSELVN